MPARFRKKPVEVEAIQWDGTVPGATTIIDWVLAHDGTATYVDYDPSREPHIAVHTPDSVGRVFPQDWAIRGTRGEFYPCMKAAFADAYEAVEGQ